MILRRQHIQPLMESDERVRRLERQAKETGSPEATAQWRRELGRTGQDHEHARPHVERWEKALKAAGWERTSFNTGAPPQETRPLHYRLQDLKDARREADKHARALARVAHELGHPMGKYIPRGSLSHDEHFSKLADLYGSKLYTRTKVTHQFLNKHGGGGHAANFDDPDKARGFAASLKHHYGDRASIETGPSRGTDLTKVKIHYRKDKDQ